MEKRIEHLPAYHANLGCTLVALGTYCADCEMDLDPELDPEDFRSPEYRNFLGEE